MRNNKLNSFLKYAKTNSISIIIKLLLNAVTCVTNLSATRIILQLSYGKIHLNSSEITVKHLNTVSLKKFKRDSKN